MAHVALLSWVTALLIPSCNAQPTESPKKPRPESTWNVGICLAIIIASDIAILLVYQALKISGYWLLEKYLEYKKRKQLHFKRWKTERAKERKERRMSSIKLSLTAKLALEMDHLKLEAKRTWSQLSEMRRGSSATPTPLQLRKAEDSMHED